VHISDCHISVGDDCITIKSGKDIPGRAKATPAENYTITNCTMLSGHGGVVIGSEMSGDVKKITISNCVFDGTDRGIRIKTARGRGGVVEDIRVDNIVMKNIKAQAIVLDMEYSKVPSEPVSERTPQFRNIRFSNITAYTKQAMYINGLDEMPVSEISLNDVVFEAETGITIRNGKDIELHNVRVNVKTGPSLSVEKTERLVVDGFVSAKPLSTAPLIRFTNVQNGLLQNSWPFAGTKTFIEIKGANTKNIIFKNNTLGEATVIVADDVTKEEVKQ
jgi:polygalacturonase